MFSQNDEESAILGHFNSLAIPRPLTFLDVGAHDGVNLSNTRQLAVNGWGGTLVEPSPAAFVALMDTYRNRADVNLVNLAIIPEDITDFGILKFNDSRGDFVSTFDEAHKKVWSAPGGNGRPGVQYQPIYVAGVSFERLLLEFPGPYSFINLDVEGINLELFRELPLRALGCELICVEYQDKLAEIEAHAKSQGYSRDHLTSENVLLRR